MNNGSIFLRPFPPAMLALVCLGSLAACHGSGGRSQAVAGDTAALATPTHENHLMGEDRSATAGDQTAVGVNAYLWRGAIDTLSFMPFASAEPAGGIIITDWYSPPTTSGERFKANAYILGKQLRSDAIRVSIFRQIQQDGQWVDAPVAANTAADITSKILARARQLRTDAGAG
ncbi:DUF3576 domain-containing protein [Lichenicola cladoniae]|nr:DUF3576 domain-containing protein [Lichenicola cladoniae]